MTVKGILMYSGGLDSLLAARILMEQGTELLGLHFVLPFSPPDYDPDKGIEAEYAVKIGLKLNHIRCGKDYIEIVKNPPHGYGKNINPCIDCKIYFLRKAREVMIREGASFVATGEVVGQRPMSQMRNMLNHIEKESGLKGYLVRPLSAKLLKPTVPEMEGLIDREKLFGISGRGRSVQMELAGKLGITDFSSPAGGCLFTDRKISARIRDLFEYCPDFSMIDFYLLTKGRHYRLHDKAKVIVGRNEKENDELEKYGEHANLLLVPEFKGPVIWVRGQLSEEDLTMLGTIMTRYAKCRVGDDIIVLFRNGIRQGTLPCGDPVSDSLLDSLRI